MRDCPIRVISCNSFTERSPFSNNAMIRRRVGSARARSDFKVADMQIFPEISIDVPRYSYIIQS